MSVFHGAPGELVPKLRVAAGVSGLHGLNPKGVVANLEEFGGRRHTYPLVLGSTAY